MSESVVVNWTKTTYGRTLILLGDMLLCSLWYHLNELGLTPVQALITKFFFWLSVLSVILNTIELYKTIKQFKG